MFEISDAYCSNSEKCLLAIFFFKISQLIFCISQKGLLLVILWYNDNIS